MKKALAIALAASFVMTIAGTAFAAEVPNPAGIKFDGSLTVQYRDDDKSNPDAASHSGLKNTIVINASKDLTKNLDLFARFTSQSFTGAADNFADYQSEKYNNAIDAFGFKYTNAGFNYVLGQAPLTLGQTGLLYDSNIFIGRHANPYVFSVNGKVGATDLTVLAAKTNYGNIGALDVDNDTIYSARGTYAVSDTTTLGATYAHVKYDSAAQLNSALGANAFAETQNYWGLDFSHKLSNKATFWGEYIKSNADSDNKAYWTGFSYKADAKNSFGASYWRVEEWAAISGAYANPAVVITSMTTQWANAKGVSLSWAHKLGSDVTLNVADHFWSKINDASFNTTNDRNTFRAGVTVNF